MNPHPTRAKPNKIGRKHTGALRQRDSQKRLNGQKQYRRTLIARSRRHAREVARYFRGERETHPLTPP
jgi:hypothetical protein